MSIVEALEVLDDHGIRGRLMNEICDALLENDEFVDDDDKKVVALLSHLLSNGDNMSALDITDEGNNRFSAGRGEYLVLTDDEREDAWEESLDSYLDECVEGSDGPYFDREKWKRDARIDGAGHSLATYDGEEHEVSDFYIYRTN